MFGSSLTQKRLAGDALKVGDEPRTAARDVAAAHPLPVHVKIDLALLAVLVLVRSECGTFKIRPK